MADSVVLIWREEKSSVRRRWFLRGVHRDGSYYGTYEIYDVRGGNLEGRMSNEDNDRFWGLVGQIRDVDRHDSASDGVAAWQGRLAVGPVTSPTIVFDYRRRDEISSPSAADFLEIVAILRPYVESQIPSEAGP